jgi:hypothetical protein
MIRVFRDADAIALNLVRSTAAERRGHLRAYAVPLAERRPGGADALTGNAECTIAASSIAVSAIGCVASRVDTGAGAELLVLSTLESSVLLEPGVGGASVQEPAVLRNSCVVGTGVLLDAGIQESRVVSASVRESRVVNASVLLESGVRACVL